MQLHTLTNQGYFLLNQKKYDTYFAAEKKIHQMLEEIDGAKKTSSFFYQTNCRAYMETEQYEEALKWINEAEKIETQSKEVKALANIQNKKIEIYRKLGRYEKAFEEYDKYLKTKEQMMSDSKREAIEKFEAKYQNEKKAKEIQSLQLDKVTLKLKSLRAQMNPHFMFNALNAINGYIEPNSINKSKDLLSKSFD